ncbi:MAG: hypothetical protein GY820_04805 [Gammaproteobacteria bacterium]|nr:hypothetical protein [Gammaproteobacteria bacterium]
MLKHRALDRVELLGLVGLIGLVGPVGLKRERLVGLIGFAGKSNKGPVKLVPVQDQYEFGPVIEDQHQHQDQFKSPEDQDQFGVEKLV